LWGTRTIRRSSGDPQSNIFAGSDRLAGLPEARPEVRKNTGVFAAAGATEIFLRNVDILHARTLRENLA